VEIEEKNDRIVDLEAAVGEIEGVYQDKIEALEADVKELKEDNVIKEQEIRTLLIDREKQKKEFKE
jgi:hypothetical protein